MIQEKNNHLQQGQASAGGVILAVIIALVIGGLAGYFLKGGGDEAMEEANKAVVERFVEEFKNKANFAVVDELYTADAKIHLPIPVPPTPEGLKMGGQAINAAFGNIVVTPEDIITTGDKVIERSTVSAVHKGDFSGIPATNRNVNWTETHIYQLRDGKIIEQWSEINIAAILAQISAPSATQ